MDVQGEPEDGSGACPLGPNTLAVQVDMHSSTFHAFNAAHSVMAGSSWFNSMFHRTNFEGSTFQASEFDGALFENCSLRGVILENCAVEGLVINGVHVGALLALLAGAPSRRETADAS